MVLMKDWGESGFTFYTNAESAKGRELAATMKAAALFHWKSLRRQVRLRGPVELVSEAEADAYFASRPRDSRIGAWASRQSQPLESRFALEKAVAARGRALRARRGAAAAALARLSYRSGRRSSSGRIGRSACMIACDFRARAPAGPRRGSILDVKRKRRSDETFGWRMRLCERLGERA